MSQRSLGEVEIEGFNHEIKMLFGVDKMLREGPADSRDTALLLSNRLDACSPNDLDALQPDWYWFTDGSYFGVNHRGPLVADNFRKFSHERPGTRVHFTRGDIVLVDDGSEWGCLVEVWVEFGVM
jgi:hypothetical protein